MQRVVSGLTAREQDAAALRALLSTEREKREKADEALKECMEQLRTELSEHKQSAVAASIAATPEVRAQSQLLSSGHWVGMRLLTP